MEVKTVYRSFLGSLAGKGSKDMTEQLEEGWQDRGTSDTRSCTFVDRNDLEERERPMRKTCQIFLLFKIKYEMRLSIAEEI